MKRDYEVTFKRRTKNTLQSRVEYYLDKTIEELLSNYEFKKLSKAKTIVSIIIKAFT